MRVCELFAGVGGFRLGLEDCSDEFRFVWANQWEPSKKVQHAYDCYIKRFGENENHVNEDISKIDKRSIPEHDLLVGGFPCQDYSVARTGARGIQGVKGVLWWQIREILREKQPRFVLLENVDRLLKSPAKQRGRDFAIMLACFNDLGYSVEWRVINAAEYGYQQRRRRTFIFAYKNNTKYADRILKSVGYADALKEESMENAILKEGFFAETFPVNKAESTKIKIKELPVEVGEVSETFQCAFENSGIMKDGIIYTMKTVPNYHGKQITLGDVMEMGQVEEQYFIPEEKLYYTDPTVTHSDETEQRLPKEDRQTWQYLKGAKKLLRTSSTGHEYVFSEGAISMIDQEDKPARTMLTSEGGFSRTTHIVKDKMTGRVRLLTATEAERIQGFPTDHTKYCLVKGETVEMPLRKRRFMMGNALVVNLVADMEKTLDNIFTEE